MLPTGIPQNVSSVTEILEQRVGDFGFDVVSTHERIADFHRVENTYLSTFQSLGGLGRVPSASLSNF
jgi:hypothetical protein